MKKLIVTNDLAQLGHALECRAHIQDAEMIEAFHTDGRLSRMGQLPVRDNPILSDYESAEQRVTTWINEIDPEVFKKIRDRSRHQTHIIHSTFKDTL